MAKKMMPKLGKGKKKNQQLYLVGGGAAVVVVIAALMHKKSAAAGTSGTATTTTGVQGTYDSSAMDFYNQIEGQFADLQGQIAKITQGSAGSGIPGGGTKGGGGTGPKPGPHPKPPKRPKRPPRTTGQTVTVSHGQTLGGIAKAHHETLSQLRQDNPIYWSNRKYQNGNRIFAGDKVKVRR